MPSRRGPGRGRAPAGLVLAAAALLPGTAAAQPAPVVLLERILAVVEGRPLLLSEVRLTQRLRGLDERTALEALIDERLMLREAMRLSQSAVTAAEEERALGALRQDHPEAGALPEEELRRLVRRQTAIVKYIDSRFRPQLSVTEQDLQRAYEEAYGGRPSPPPLEEVVPQLRTRLLDRALDARIEAWVAELRASAEIRYNPG